MLTTPASAPTTPPSSTSRRCPFAHPTSSASRRFSNRTTCPAATCCTSASATRKCWASASTQRRLSPRCRLIDGITVAEAERQRGRATGLANYRALKANKYAVSLPAILNRHYDHIIDNNLASFACCGFHLMVMFSSYRLMLRPGGSILTDRQGMEWTVNDAKWKLTESDLETVATRFNLTLSKTTEWVYELTKPRGG